jgi:hypothetical protein
MTDNTFLFILIHLCFSGQPLSSYKLHQLYLYQISGLAVKQNPGRISKCACLYSKIVQIMRNLLTAALACAKRTRQPARRDESRPEQQRNTETLVTNKLECDNMWLVDGYRRRSQRQNPASSCGLRRDMAPGPTMRELRDKGMSKPYRDRRKRSKYTKS